MSTVTLHKCDVCGGDAAHLKVQVQVVFTTEQTEGRPTSPHLVINPLDLCNACLRRVIAEMPIRASGAQGYNKYEWSR